MIPASIRNKNPGAQEPGPSSKRFGSSSHEVLRWTYKGKPAVNKIATFPTNEHGAAAMFDLLSRKYTGKTIEKAIATWCGGYYAGAYAKALEANGGIKASDTLTADLMRNPEFAIPLCKAMARVEAGKDFPLSDAEWQEAHAMAFSGATAPEFSPDNDVPSPGPNARMTAEIKDVAIKAALPTIVGAGGVAVSTAPTPAPKALPSLPKPPQEILDTAGLWKGWGATVAEFGTWAVSSPTAIGIIAVSIAVLTFGPKLAPKLFGRE